MSRPSGLNVAAYGEVGYEKNTYKLTDNGGYYEIHAKAYSNKHELQGGLVGTIPLGHNGGAVTAKVGYATGYYANGLQQVNRLGIGDSVDLITPTKTPFNGVTGEVSVSIPLL